jgi:hypothetical protein
MHLLQQPEHYRVGVLPKHLRRKAARQLSVFAADLQSGPHDPADIARFADRQREICDNILRDSAPGERHRFRRFLKAVDEVRQEDSARTLAKLAPALSPRARLRSWLQHFGRAGGMPPVAR